MPNALPCPIAETTRRARRDAWWVLVVCVLTSLLLHGMLVCLWPGYGGAGIRTARLRATIHSLPDAPLPGTGPVSGALQAPALQNLVEPSTQRTAQDKDSGKVSPEKQTQQAFADQLPEDSGGGQLSEYVPAELLTTKPRFLVDLREYIPASLEASESGRIVVQVLIGLGGEVDGVVVEHSELTPRGTRRFIQRLDALKLAPASRDGLPVKARWRMEFKFSPQTD